MSNHWVVYTIEQSTGDAISSEVFTDADLREGNADADDFISLMDAGAAFTFGGGAASFVHVVPYAIAQAVTA